MMRSLTTESIILLKAAPMMTPTARSRTLPRRANSRNSFSMFKAPGGFRRCLEIPLRERNDYLISVAYSRGGGGFLWSHLSYAGHASCSRAALGAVADFGDAEPGQFVGALVLGVAGVALHTFPLDLMDAGGLLQRLPQLGVLHRLLGGGFPAVALPVEHPLGDAVAHVNAVGRQDDMAGALEGAQRLDGRHQLHAVVGGVGLAAVNFLGVAAGAQDRAPAA